MNEDAKRRYIMFRVTGTVYECMRLTVKAMSGVGLAKVVDKDLSGSTNLLST